MHIETSHSRPNITFAQMKRFLTIGWGKLGEEREFSHYGGECFLLWSTSYEGVKL
jgi:hypothetical protein